MRMTHRKTSKFITVFLILSLLFGCLMPASSAYAKRKQARPKKGNFKYADILMDADTGQILHESNPDKPLHPASLTKIMTLLMAFEALDQGKIQLNTPIKISKHAANMAPSKIGLTPGKSIPLKDAIGVVVTKSANDISAALAENLAGSEDNFARRMTQRARQIGMRNSTFVNASGLHDPRQKSSARDMAILARYVINHYPTYYKYFSMQNYNYNGRTYPNHNHLMKTYEGMDGMKTGYTVPSGFNLVASAVQGNHRLIGVVFGGLTTKSRNAQMAKLLDQGFRDVGNPQIAKIEKIVPKVAPQEAQDNIKIAATPLIPEKTVAPLKAEPVTKQKTKHKPKEEAKDDAAKLAALSPALTQKGKPAPLTPTTLARISPASAPTMQKGPDLTPASYASPSRTHDRKAPWSVQIGAFSSRAMTDQTIQKALNQLPQPYAQAQPLIAPLKTSEGWLFRARLTGFTKTEALAACNYLRECLPVAPEN